MSSCSLQDTAEHFSLQSNLEGTLETRLETLNIQDTSTGEMSSTRESDASPVTSRCWPPPPYPLPVISIHYKQASSPPHLSAVQLRTSDTGLCQQFSVEALLTILTACFAMLRNSSQFSLTVVQCWGTHYNSHCMLWNVDGVRHNSHCPLCNVEA